MVIPSLWPALDPLNSLCEGNNQLIVRGHSIQVQPLVSLGANSMFVSVNFLKASIFVSSVPPMGGKIPCFSPAVSFSPVRGISWFPEVDILHFLIAVLSRLQGQCSERSY